MWWNLNFRLHYLHVQIRNWTSTCFSASFIWQINIMKEFSRNSTRFKRYIKFCPWRISFPWIPGESLKEKVINWLYLFESGRIITSIQLPLTHNKSYQKLFEYCGVFSFAIKFLQRTWNNLFLGTISEEISGSSKHLE